MLMKLALPIVMKVSMLLEKILSVASENVRTAPWLNANIIG